MSNNRNLLAKRIKTFREKSGWSQVDLAERSKTTSTTISAIETGRVATNIDLLDALADAFGISVADLFKTDKEPKPRIERIGLYQDLSPIKRRVVDMVLSADDAKLEQFLPTFDMIIHGSSVQPIAERKKKAD